MSKARTGYKMVLKQKQYCKLIIANMVNRFGDSIDSIAFTWLIYALTNNATWSAIIFGINKIPTIFFQPFAGALVENRNKKIIMILTDIIRGLCVGFVAMAYFIGFLQPWMLIIITLIISTVEAFNLPASSSVVLNILDRDSLEFGMSLNSSMSSVIELVGLGAAGIIISQFGITAAIAIDAITFFGSALIKTMINTQERKYEKTKVNIKAYLEILKEGTKYVGTKKIVFNLIILAVLGNAIFVPFNSLQAPLTKEVLGSGEEMLALLSIAMTIGMLLATVIFPYVARKLSGKAFIGVGGSAFGSFYIIIVLIGSYFNNSKILLYSSVAVVTFLAGMCITILSLYISVTFMKSVEKEYIARSAAIMNAAGASAIPLVSFIISAIVAFISTKTIFIISGILMVSVMLVLAFKMNFEIEEKKANELELEGLKAEENMDQNIESIIKDEIIMEEVVGNEIMLEEGRV